MIELKDLCCVEACVLLSPNERQGAELVRLGLLELSQLPLLTIRCSPASTTIEITGTQLNAIHNHDIYKAFHIFLKELYVDKSVASLDEIISTVGLGLEGFHKYAITTSLKSKNLVLEEEFKRFFVFKRVRLKLTDTGKTLKKELSYNLEHPEHLLKQHALLVPNQTENFDHATQTMMKCFNKSYAKQFKHSSAKIVKEPGLF